MACTGGEIVEVSKDTIPDSNASASYDVNGPALRSALRSSGAEIVNIFDDDGGGSGGGDDDDVKTRIIREARKVRSWIRFAARWRQIVTF